MALKKLHKVLHFVEVFQDGGDLPQLLASLALGVRWRFGQRVLEFRGRRLQRGWAAAGASLALDDGQVLSRGGGFGDRFDGRFGSGFGGGFGGGRRGFGVGVVTGWRGFEIWIGIEGAFFWGEQLGLPAVVKQFSNCLQ